MHVKHTTIYQALDLDQIYQKLKTLELIYQTANVYNTISNTSVSNIHAITRTLYNIRAQYKIAEYPNIFIKDNQIHVRTYNPLLNAN